MKIAVVAAMRIELMPTIRSLNATRHRVGTVDLYRGGPLTFTVGGIGSRVVDVTTALVDEIRPDALISTGVVGSLVAQLEVGRLILGGTPEVPADPTLLESSTRVSPEAHVGDVVSVPRVVVDPSERDRIRQAHPHALAVDMESAAIGSIARAHGLPFLVARTVLDTPDQPLASRYERLGSVATEILHRRVSIRAIVQDIQRARLAAARLARFFEGLSRALDGSGST